MFEHAEIQLVPLQEQMAFLKTKKEKLLLPSGDEKEKSLAVNETALEFITEQVELIEKQVRNIQERYLISLEVLKAKFNFVPVSGETYYLYQKKHERVLMLVGPHQWELDSETFYIATVKLMADASWHILSINSDLDIDFKTLNTK